MPDLQPTSDSGLSQTDNITNVREAVIDIETTQAGDTIRVYLDGAMLGEAVQVQDTLYRYAFAADQLEEVPTRSRLAASTEPRKVKIRKSWLSCST